LKLFIRFSFLFILCFTKSSIAQDFAARDSFLLKFYAYNGVHDSIIERDTVYMNILNELAYEYIFINPDSALYFADLGLAKIKDDRFFRYKANSLMYKGMALETIGENYEAVNYMEKAQLLFMKNNDSLSLAKTLINKSNIYIAVQNYRKSLEALLQAKKIIEKLNKEFVYYQCITNIGALYILINDFKSGGENLMDAYQYYKKIKNDKGLAIVCHGLGDLCKRKKDKDCSEQYYKESIFYAKKTPDRYGLAGTMINLSLLYTNYFEHEKAIPYIKEAIEISARNGNLLDELISNIILAKIYSNLNQVEKAKNILNSKRKLILNAKTNKLLESFYDAEYQIAKKEGNYKKAIEALKLQKEYSDSLIYLTSKQDAYFLNLENQNLEKEKLLVDKLLKEQKLSIQSQLNTNLQSRNYYLLLASFFLLVFIIAGIYFFFRLNQLRSKLRSLNNKLDYERDVFLKGPIVVFELLSDISFNFKFVSQNINELLAQLNQQQTINGFEEFVDDFEIFKSQFTENRKRGLTNFRISFSYFKNHQTKIAVAHFKIAQSKSKGNDTIIGFILDITEKDALINELAKQKSLLLQTNKIGKVGGYKFDKNGIIWSELAFKLVGLAVDSKIALSETINFFKAGQSRDKFKQHNLNLIGEGKSFDDEFEIISANKEDLILRITGNPIYNNNKIVGAQGVFVDITTAKKQEFTLKHMLEANKNQSERLQNFTYVVSHNLRSHSANYQMLIDILKEEEHEDQFFELVNSLEENTVRLEETLENLNEVIKVQNNIDAVYKSINPFNVIQNQIKLLVEQNNLEEAEIETNVDKDLIFNYVPAYFESIVYNLISNALKYRHPERKLRISIDMKKSDDRVVLSVADNGLGIDLDKNAENLFGMFKTFHLNKDARGIGLHITKNQIESTGGKIEVSSTINIGSVFTVTFINENDFMESKIIMMN